MTESVDKYKGKENYVVPMTVSQKSGHLHAVMLREMAPEYLTGKRVLHAGCNAGTTTYHVSPLNPASLTGLDVNEEAIVKARLILPSAMWVVGSIHDMPFPDNSFDTIILFAVFEHLYKEDKEAGTKELERILSPGGHILVQLPRAVPGSKDQRLKQNAYDPHHISFYYQESDVSDDFPGWECLELRHEARRNPNNKAAHNSWVGIFVNPKAPVAEPAAEPVAEPPVAEPDAEPVKEESTPDETAAEAMAIAQPVAPFQQEAPAEKDNGKGISPDEVKADPKGAPMRSGFGYDKY